MVAAGTIKVAVRVRPPTSFEAARLPQTTYDNTLRGDGALSTPGRTAASSTSVRDVIRIVDDRVLTFDPDEKDPSRAFVERGFLPPGTKRYKDRRFIFDKVFDHQARQEDVYRDTAKPLLSNLLDGFNATIFAYGVRIYSIVALCAAAHVDAKGHMADLFQQIEDRKDDYIVEVVVTFLEIYNEEIRDLLAEPGNPTPRGGLQIREDKAVKVVGLAELRPTSADEVKQIVLLGNSRRTQSPTHANETSSRSHAVLQVHVTQAPRTASLTEQRTMGTLSIIDLAGSERAAATSNMGQRMVEGANINKSLLALGNCINALCESAGAVRHVPYRNSKLTRLLKFSLGGNCKTVMIVCIAPTSIHFDDTQNTLLYAERATRIKTKVVTRNVVNVDRHVGQYVEAINRLNIEVAELKAKLSGKRDQEAEKERRKRKEAAQEVEKSKNDMQSKAEQTLASIVDGATCAGKIAVAKAKVKVIQARLAQLDSQASSSSPLSSDLEAERQLLQALMGPEEQVLKAESALNARLQRSNNSAAMFEATLRALSERKSEKLDELSVDNVKLDARWRKAEMERVKAQAGQDALQEAVTSQTEAVVSLIGMVSRCTVMLGEASQLLTTAVGEGRDGLEGTVRALAASLKNVAENNDETFKGLVGQSIASYALGASPAPASSLNNFKGYGSLGIGRVVSGPVFSQQSKPRISRRSSSYGSSLGSPHKSGKSPRKSLRSSITAAAVPYRRVSDNSKGKKKGVQWRDEAGQGEIDDGGEREAQVVVITTASPEVSAIASGSSSLPTRPMSLGSSESEWEDEKTEDSLNVSMTAAPSRDIIVPTSIASANGLRKRPRASRLDPGFLKGKSRCSTLDSLAEADETLSTPKRPSPLSDLNMNRAASPEGSTSSTSTLDALHIPKGRERSPAKRVLITPKVVGMSKGGRRRSNIGPMRNDRPRRRSSMIPQLSPIDLNANESASVLQLNVPGARRVPVNIERSPAKRPKRMSLLAVSSARLSQPRLSASTRVRIPDANSSSDISFKAAAGAGSSRPSWK